MADAADRVALVIGNGAYRLAPALPNPRNDAADMAAALRRIGFDVVEGRDLDKRAMEAKIIEFSRKLDDANLALVLLRRPRPAGRRQELSGAGRRQDRARGRPRLRDHRRQPGAGADGRRQAGQPRLPRRLPRQPARPLARAQPGDAVRARGPGARQHPERHRHHDRLCDAARQRRARRHRPQQPVHDRHAQAPGHARPRHRLADEARARRRRAGHRTRSRCRGTIPR